MNQIIDEVCAEVRNYFTDRYGGDIHFGHFSIKDDVIEPLDFLYEGQYFRIVGSVLNDGVYQYPDYTGLSDEEFDGAIWAMSVPASFERLCAEIENYQNSDAAKNSGYVSESFGGYSYTKATGANGAPLSWQQVFAKRLNLYRKL